jgi:hypothetical protein
MTPSYLEEITLITERKRKSEERTTNER